MENVESAGKTEGTQVTGGTENAQSTKNAQVIEDILSGASHAGSADGSVGISRDDLAYSAGTDSGGAGTDSGSTDGGGSEEPVEELTEELTKNPTEGAVEGGEGGSKNIEDGLNTDAGSGDDSSILEDSSILGSIPGLPADDDVSLVTAEESFNAPRNSVDSYFDDDDQMIDSSRDETVFSDDVSSVFKQSDDIVNIEVGNYMGENGEPRHHLAMKNDPPVLSISSLSGKKVDFVLTQGLAQHLSELQANVDRGYKGQQPNKKKEKKEPLSFKSSVDRIVEYVTTYPVKSLLAVIVVVLVIVGLIRF